MIMTLGLLLTVIPALLLVWGGARLAASFSESARKRAWIVFLLLVAALMLFLATFYADRFYSGDFPLFLLLLFPTMEALLVLLLLDWREIYSLWQAEKGLFSVLLLALFFLLASTARVGLQAPLTLLVPALLTALLWMALGRSRLVILVLVSLALCLYLFADALGLVGNHLVMSALGLRTAYSLATALVTFLALGLATLFVFRRAGEGNRRSRSLLLLAAVLVLAVALNELRHGLLARATGRAAEDHMPFLTVLIIILFGAMLTRVAPRGRKIAGAAFTLLVPAMIVGAYMTGWQIDPQAITSARAARLARAVESYHQDTDAYPASLEALTPGYLPVILGPLTGRGQVWCYQGGRGFFRLGYVFYQRYYTPTFPTPYFEIKVPASAGEVPSGGWMCDRELELFKQHRGL